MLPAFLINYYNLYSCFNQVASLDQQRKVETALVQWSAYSEGQESLEKWMSGKEAMLQTDNELRGTLQEKRVQLQNNKVNNYYITKVLL